MGSLIGTGLSLYQYQDQKNQLKKTEAKAEAAEAEAEAEEENLERMTAAEAQNPDSGGIESEMNKKRKGVQSTMLASKGV